jgi:hypothetical protein
MITITKDISTRINLHEGILVEQSLVEDESEIFEHPFVIEVAEVAGNPDISLNVAWIATEPVRVNEWEQVILSNFIDAHL